MWDAWEGDKQYPLPAPPLVHPTPSPRCRAPRPPPTPLRANGACEQGGANGVRCPLVATPLPCACPLSSVRATSRGCAPPLFGAPPLPLRSYPPLSTCAQNGGHTRPPCFRAPPTPQFPRPPFAPPSFERKRGMGTGRANWGGAQTAFASTPSTPVAARPRLVRAPPFGAPSPAPLCAAPFPRVTPPPFPCVPRS